MDDVELLGKMLFVARKSAMFLLDKHGSVAPFAALLDPAGDNPKTCFPRDAHRSAQWDELLDFAADYLEQQIAASAVGAIAVCTTLESGSDRAVGIQAETQESAVLLVYPCHQTGDTWHLSEPETADGLLLDPLLVRSRP